MAEEEEYLSFLSGGRGGNLAAEVAMCGLTKKAYIAVVPRPPTSYKCFVHLKI